MRVFILAAAALCVSVPALADNPHNNPSSETNVSGGAAGIHIDGFSFDASGTTDSTSGAAVDFSAEGNGLVGFASNGVAGAFASAGLGNSTSATFHSATLVAGALGDAELSGNAATFGNAESSFDLSVGEFNAVLGGFEFSFED